MNTTKSAVKERLLAEAQSAATPDPSFSLADLFAFEAAFHAYTCGCAGCCAARYEKSEDGLSYNRVTSNDGDPQAIYRFAPPSLSTSATASQTAGGIDFTLTILDQSGDAAPFITQIENAMTAVFETLSLFIDGAGVIDIEISVEDFEDDEDEPGFTLASAGPETFIFDGVRNGVTVFEAGTIRELTTGVDPNGAAADGGITIGLEFLEDFAFFDANPAPGETVPGAQIDLFSVLFHEMLHVLGYIGFRDAETFELDDGDGSTFDTFIDFDDDGLPIFVGENAVEFYGAAVPLESQRDAGSNLYHISDEDGPREDLSNALISAAANFGEREAIGSLELAILQDLGLDVTIPTDLQLIDFRDGGLVPTTEVAPGAVAVEEDGVVSIQIVRDGLASGLPSVGYEIVSGTATAGEDFVAQTGRFVFVPQALDGAIEIELLDDDIADTGETIIVRLFNPANTSLPSGGLIDEFTVVIQDSDTNASEEQTGPIVRGDDVFRFLNTQTGVHTFTPNPDLIADLIASGEAINLQFVGFESLSPLSFNAQNINQFFNPASGAVFFTIDETEAAAFENDNPDFTRIESPELFAASSDFVGGAPVVEFFNPNNNSYFYTQNINEIEILSGSSVFENRGVAFFAGVNARTFPLDDDDVLRFFDRQDFVHIFTADQDLQDQLLATAGRFRFEGVGFENSDQAPDAEPVIQFVNPDDGAVFFTLDEAEASSFAAANPDFVMTDDGAFEASPTPFDGGLPVTRFFNTITGGYFYTLNEAEAARVNANLPAFVDQGVVFYASPNTPPDEEDAMEANVTVMDSDANILI